MKKTSHSFKPKALVAAIALVLSGSQVDAAILTVSNTDDAGAGSLRQTIIDAISGDTITFNSNLSGMTINLVTSLSLNKNLIINGDFDGSNDNVSDITLDGMGNSRILNVTNTDATLNSLKIQNGYSLNDGGGIRSNGTLTINNSTLSGNTTDSCGAGISNGGTLTINNSTLSGNSADGCGGGISNSGALTINNSTLSGNSAFDTGGGISNGGTLIINNSTLSGNSASHGGGIHTGSPGTVTLNNSTLSGNRADPGSGGGGVYSYTGTLTFKNSVISNSNGANCYIYIPPTASDHNWFDDSSCNSINSGDPMLGALADNGGPTLTHLPQAGSGLINAGNNATCTSSDQRGIARPQDTDCDIGAVESDLIFKDGFE